MEKVIAAAIILAVMGGCSYGVTTMSEKQVTDTVIRNGERVCSSDGESTSCKYLEFFENETFENTDSFWYGKWNSSDLHARLVPGVTCEMTVTGWRIPFFSAYRNIVRAECSK